MIDEFGLGIILQFNIETCIGNASLAEVFCYVNYVNVNYSVKNSTVACKYLLYLLGVSRSFFETAVLAFFVLFWF